MYTVAEYERGSQVAWDNAAEAQRKMLEAHFLAPEQALTVDGLSGAAGFNSHHGVDLQYGLLGDAVREALGRQEVPEPTKVPARWEEPNWILHPEVSQAIEGLGWAREGSWPSST